MIKFPKKINDNKIKKFFLSNNLDNLISLSKSPDLKTNQLKLDSPFKPDLRDLYRLYQLVVLNKRTTILEFGSGWSS